MKLNVNFFLHPIPINYTKDIDKEKNKTRRPAMVSSDYPFSFILEFFFDSLRSGTFLALPFFACIYILRTAFILV